MPLSGTGSGRDGRASFVNFLCGAGDPVVIRGSIGVSAEPDVCGTWADRLGGRRWIRVDCPLGVDFSRLTRSLGGNPRMAHTLRHRRSVHAEGGRSPSDWKSATTLSLLGNAQRGTLSCWLDMVHPWGIGGWRVDGLETFDSPTAGTQQSFAWAFPLVFHRDGPSGTGPLGGGGGEGDERNGGKPPRDWYWT